METLIRRKKAPQNSVAPLKIETEGLFELDVDDDIWLDVGIGYDDEGDDTVPPLWLSNEKVRDGIRAMTDRDRCMEEGKRLLNKRYSMQVWFNEEWQVVNAAIDQSKWSLARREIYLLTFTSNSEPGMDIDYQLKLRKDKLCCLFVAWE